MNFIKNEGLAPMEVEKIKILGGRFGATRQNGPNWQCCLAGSFKKAPRILIFSIALGAEYSFYMKSIATYALQKVDIIIHSQAVCNSSTSKVF